MDLDDVLVDLYLRAPAEFTAVRASRVAAAKDDGDPDLARKIGRLPKPSASAWLVNLLASRKSAEIDQLIALGAEMREAESELDAGDLRRLGKQRLLLIRSIAAIGKDLAARAGHRMSAAALIEVEQTLHAAMADDRAADAIRSGRLLRGLTSSGIDPVDLDGAVALPSVIVERAPRPSLHAVDDEESGRRLAEAEAKARDARSSATAAEDARSELRGRRTALGERRLALGVERERLEAELARVEQDLTSLDRDDAALGRAAASADRTADVAVRAAERAEKRLADLQEGRKA